MKKTRTTKSKSLVQRLFAVALILCQLLICIPDCTAKAATEPAEASSVSDRSIFTSTNNYPSILYIGNSKTYYNGMPRMVENLSYKDDSCTSPSKQTNTNFTALTWGAHSLLAWATGWDKDKYKKNKENQSVDPNLYDAIKNNKNNNKKLFTTTASKNQFDCIRKALYKNKEAIKYDAVVLQGNPSDLNGNYYAQAVTAICQLLVDNGNITYDTPIVINSMYNVFTTGKNKNGIKISKMWENQAKYDNNSLYAKYVLTDPENNASLPIRKCKDSITRKSPFTDVRIAYCGRAFLNFLTAFNSNAKETFKTEKTRQYGYSDNFSSSTTQKYFEPVDKNDKSGAAVNDLIIADGRHPTILGSLLEASVIYNTLNPSANSIGSSHLYYGVVGGDFYFAPLNEDMLDFSKNNHKGDGFYGAKITSNKYIAKNIFSVAQKTYQANKNHVYDSANNPFTNALENYKAEDYFPVHNYNCEVDGVTVANIECYATYSGLTEPTKEGYTFLGWNSSPNGDGYTIDNEVAVGADDSNTIYAVWQDNTETKTNGLYDVKIIKAIKKPGGKNAVIYVTKPQKSSSISGYLIRISTNKKMRRAKTYFVKYKGTTKSTVTLSVPLASKDKTNYVKLVVYKRKNGKYKFGKYTDVAEVK